MSDNKRLLFFEEIETAMQVNYHLFTLPVGRSHKKEVTNNRRSIQWVIIMDNVGISSF